MKRGVILYSIGFETGYSFEIVSLSKHSIYDKNNVIENITVNISRQSLKTPLVNAQSTVIERKKRLVYNLISVKRAVILNNIGFETKYSFK